MRPEIQPLEKLMEEILNECMRRMGEIDEEVARLHAEREEVEERATKARFGLLRKCEEALGLFTHQLEPDPDGPMNRRTNTENISFEGKEPWRLNS